MRKSLLYAAVASTLFVMSSAAGAAEIGIYAGSGCNGLPHLTSYQTWLGAPAAHVTENFDQSSWANMVNDAGWSISCYAQVRDTVGFTFSVPMLPADGVSTLAQGAAGAYDAYFITVAQYLVADGLPTATVRIGWEFNGNWQPWSSYKDPANFITFYRRIVTKMKSVSGARFAFEWCPNLGIGSLAPNQSYPGDAYVDVVGMDVYEGVWSAIDDTPAGRWTDVTTQAYGLDWQVNFAKAHMKRLSLPEWGCCGNGAGDDPYFVNHISMFIRSHGYLYADYWDTNSAYPGMLSGGQYPNAAATYIADFKGQ
ncbi:MAG TPA: glycosyl hydrolase [Stellaceae bacterium]|nr:glycosyl hydrolase [Stellaceae bacterium]